MALLAKQPSGQTLCTPFAILFTFEALGSMSKNCFGINLLTLSCKLGHYIKISNIYGIVTKRSSLQK
jgi:hypothetical protein